MPIPHVQRLLRRSKVVPRPVIRRTRSWRGFMQVRFDDTALDRRRIFAQFFLYAPLRVCGVTVLVTCAAYYMIGHDLFMHYLLGYESEMQYEGRVNPINNHDAMAEIFSTKAVFSPVRNLEKPLHPQRTFGILRDPKSS